MPRYVETQYYVQNGLFLKKVSRKLPGQAKVQIPSGILAPVRLPWVGEAGNQRWMPSCSKSTHRAPEYLSPLDAKSPILWMWRKSPKTALLRFSFCFVAWAGGKKGQQNTRSCQNRKAKKFFALALPECFLNVKARAAIWKTKGISANVWVLSF